MTDAVSKKLCMTFIAAFLLFGGTFGFALNNLDFWWSMAISIVLLVALSLFFDPVSPAQIFGDLRKQPLEKAFIALGSAMILYGVFYAGYGFSRSVFDEASVYVQSVYRLREGATLTKVLLLITLVIGPGEEIFWRHYFQKNLIGVLGVKRGLLAASLAYAAVHLCSFNPMLMLAAFICGLCWGSLFLWKRSLVINCLSHVIWDLAVFVWFPFS